jgi:hypothetical protein
MAVVLTVVPANDTDAALHRVTVHGSDVTGLVPPRLADQIRRSRGPTMQIRIPASIEQARVAWSDDDAVTIERALGLRGDDGGDFVDLDKLTVNLGETSGGGRGASLTQIARAAAVRAWATMADRDEGSQAQPLTTSLRIGGWMEFVRHALSQGGEAMTIVQMASRLPPMSLFAYMDDGTRRVVGRLVDRGVA